MLKAVKNPEYRHYLDEAVAMEKSLNLPTIDPSRSPRPACACTRQALHHRSRAGQPVGYMCCPLLKQRKEACRRAEGWPLRRPYSNVADTLAVNIGALMLDVVPGRVHAGPLLLGLLTCAALTRCLHAVGALSAEPARCTAGGAGNPAPCGAAQVSTECDAHLSLDTQATIDKARAQPALGCPPAAPCPA